MGPIDTLARLRMLHGTGVTTPALTDPDGVLFTPPAANWIGFAPTSEPFFAAAMAYEAHFLGLGIAQPYAGQLAQGVMAEMAAGLARGAAWAFRNVPGDLAYLPFFDVQAQHLDLRALGALLLSGPISLLGALLQAPFHAFYQPAWVFAGGRGLVDPYLLANAFRPAQDDRLAAELWAARMGLSDHRAGGARMRALRDEALDEQRRPELTPVERAFVAHVEHAAPARSTEEIRTDLDDAGLFNVVTDEEATRAASELARLDPVTLARTLDELGPEAAVQLEEELPRESQIQHGPTLERMRIVQNLPRARATDTEAEAEAIEEAVSTGLTDWTVSDEEARAATHRLSRYGGEDLRAVVRATDVDALTRLEEEMSPRDRAYYAPSVERVRAARNAPDRTGIDDASEVAAELSDALSYGVLDWRVTDSESRSVVDRLARLQTPDLRRVIDEIGPNLTNRLERELSELDAEIYGPTVERIRTARNTPRVDLDDPAGLAESIEDRLGVGLTDWGVSDAEARSVIHDLGRLEEDDLSAVLDRVGPDRLTDLVGELSDQDRAIYRPTLDRIERLRNRVSPGASDPAQTAGDAGAILDGLYLSESESRQVIDELSAHGTSELRDIVGELGPDRLHRLRDGLSDADRRIYRTTLARLTAAQNTAHTRPSDIGAYAESVSEPLEYGFTDWGVSEGEARQAIDRLSRLDDASLRAVVRRVNADVLDRIAPNLDDTDRATYAATLQRLQRIRGR